MRSWTWVGYTTRYREGGPQLRAAARTLARHAEGAVRCEPVETKGDFVRAMRRISRAGDRIERLHLVCHSGMYGPMFGTTDLPEQFSPHGWRQLQLPFAEGASAHFHACRTARWFAPFFARTTGVPTHGFHGYTTFSRARDRYRWLPPGWKGDVWVLDQPGRKSHGLLGTLGKHSGLLPPRPALRFEPAPPTGDPSYDGVARLYDAAFSDIRLRAAEWAWLDRRIPEGQRLLDLGCGTGALLRALAPRLEWGLGVDRSEPMLARARAHSSGAHIDFARVEGPELPLADNSVDVVVSLLSFRYLDWDQVLAEIVRVLRPGGRLLVVDMVTRPAALHELPRVLHDALRAARSRRAHPGASAALQRLVQDPRWQDMLRHNPIRAEHELSRFLRSRFPGRSLHILDVGRTSRVLAFDSGPISPRWMPPQSYP